MGHVSRLEKHERAIWKVCMRMSRIDYRSLWCSWMKEVVGGWHLGSRLIYRLMRRRIFMAKFCIGGERM